LTGSAIVAAVDSFKNAGRVFKPALVGALALGLGTLTWRHEHVFQNEQTLWSQTLEKNPGAAIARVNLATIAIDSGHPDEVLAQGKMLLDAYPEDPTILNIVGSAHLELGHYDAAIDFFQKSVARRADNPRPWYNLALAFAQKGQADRAEKLFEKVVELDPNAANAHSQLANLFLRRHQYKEAIPHLRRRLELQPADFQACDMLAWILATSPEPALRNGPEAVELAARANNLTAGRRAGVRRTLAAAYAECGDFPKAIESIQLAIGMANSRTNSVLAASCREQLALYQSHLPFHAPDP
jgi:Flp pilus assembly protein TadD